MTGGLVGLKKKTHVSKSLTVRVLRKRHWLPGGLVGLKKHMNESLCLRVQRKRHWLTGGLVNQNRYI